MSDPFIGDLSRKFRFSSSHRGKNEHMGSRAVHVLETESAACIV